MPRIRFFLNTPIALYGQRPFQPLMFDGILGYAWAIRNGLTKTPRETVPANLMFPDLPLDLAGEKCYAASAAFVPPEARLEYTQIVRSTN